MKRILISLALIFAFSATSWAEGSFPFDDLVPILQQKPDLTKYLLTTLDFAEGSLANRVGSNVNT